MQLGRGADALNVNGVVIKILIYVDPMNDVHITAKVGETIYRLRATATKLPRADERPLDL